MSAVNCYSELLVAIRKWMRVRAYNEATGEVELREVTETIVRGGAPIVEVVVLFKDGLGHARRDRAPRPPARP